MPRNFGITIISGVIVVKITYLWQIVKLARLPIVLAVISIFLIGPYMQLYKEHHNSSE